MCDLPSPLPSELSDYLQMWPFHVSRPLPPCVLPRFQQQRLQMPLLQGRSYLRGAHPGLRRGKLEFAKLSEPGPRKSRGTALTVSRTSSQWPDTSLESQTRSFKHRCFCQLRLVECTGCSLSWSRCMCPFSPERYDSPSIGWAYQRFVICGDWYDENPHSVRFSHTKPEICPQSSAFLLTCKLRDERNAPPGQRRAWFGWARRAERPKQLGPSPRREENPRPIPIRQRRRRNQRRNAKLGRTDFQHSFPCPKSSLRILMWFQRSAIYQWSWTSPDLSKRQVMAAY